MAELVQIGVPVSEPGRGWKTVYWLQGVTLAWMLIECGVSLYAAAQARSSAMLAFGADSVVELLSACIVLLQFSPRFAISRRSAARAAGALLFVLAVVVGSAATGSMVFCVAPAESRIGMAITILALIAMPILAKLKRREAHLTNDAALAADAVQSATCAYLAAIALAGLAMHALFHVAWFDPIAALAAIPFLLKEAREAWRGKTCGCC